MKLIFKIFQSVWELNSFKNFKISEFQSVWGRGSGQEAQSKTCFFSPIFRDVLTNFQLCMWCCDLNISPRRDAKPNLCTGRTVSPNFFGLRQCLHDFISFHIEAVFMFSLGLNCKPSLSGHRDLDQTWRGGGAKGQMGRCRHLQTHIFQSIFDDCWYNGVMKRFQTFRIYSIILWKGSTVIQVYATNVSTLDGVCVSLSRSGSRQRLSHPMTKRSSWPGMLRHTHTHTQVVSTLWEQCESHKHSTIAEPTPWQPAISVDEVYFAALAVCGVG